MPQPLSRWVPPSSSARRFSLTEDPEGIVIYQTRCRPRRYHLEEDRRAALEGRDLEGGITS